MEGYPIYRKTEGFLRREDPSGQVESICLYSFETVARSDDLAFLKSQERQHDCPAQTS